MRWQGLGQRLNQHQQAAVEVIRQSGAFSNRWYRRQQPHLTSDPVIHYVVKGAQAGLNPHPVFDTEWYRLRYPAIAQSEQNPFVDYLTEGWRAGRDPGPLLDTSWYCARHPEVALSGTNPLSHFDAADGRRQDAATPLFDAGWYEDRLGHALQQYGNGFEHFMELGLYEGRDPGPYFSTDWYREQYGDLLVPGKPAFWHYTALGAAQGLNPGPGFDAAWYRRQYLRGMSRGRDPLVDFLDRGKLAGHLPSSPSASLGPHKIAVIAHAFYKDVWPQILSALRRIPFPFDLFVTCPADKRQDFQRVVSADFPDARVLANSNQGRDIGPFFQALLKAEAVDDYLAICKIHSKKGITEPDVWRHELIDSVLGSSTLIRDIVQRFVSDPDVGIVGPQGLFISGKKFMNENGENVDRIVRALYVNGRRPAEWGFFAGTMFWFRPSLFALLARYVAEYAVFESSNASNDGQVAHALERVFGIVPALARRKVGLVQSDAAGRHRLTVCETGENISYEPPTRYLRRKGIELQGRIFIAG